VIGQITGFNDAGYCVATCAQTELASKLRNTGAMYSQKQKDRK